VARAKCPCGCKAGRFRIPRGAKYDPAKADRAVRFFEGYLTHTKGRFAGEPFLLEGWEEWHIVRPIFGIMDRATRLRWYKEALILLPRKNGKSEIAAGVNLYMLLADGEASPEVYSLAGDRAQASLVFQVASAMVRANPRLRAACKVYRSVIEVPEINGLYRVLSSDANLQHGLNPSAATVDEYHIHRNAEQYEAMASGVGARLSPLIFVISTVGDEESGPLWDMEQRALSGNDPRLYYYRIGAPDRARVDDPRTWKAANPASWVSEEFLAAQFARLPLNVFERLHLNRWPTKGSGAWAPRDKFVADCAGKPVIDPDAPVYVAVDSAPKRDRTAVILDQRDASGVHNVRVWHWRADPELGYLDFTIIEDFLRDLARDFNVQRIVCDPFGMIRSMQILAAEGLPVEDYPQNHARMAPASMGLHELVTAGLIAHGGDEDLIEAFDNAIAREIGAYGWRLDRPAGSTGHIDELIALAMVTRIAEQEAANFHDGPRVITV